LNYSFTAAFKLNSTVKDVKINQRPRLNSVAALPCKIYMFNSTIYNSVIQLKIMQNRLITVIIHRRCQHSFSYVQTD